MLDIFILKKTLELAGKGAELALVTITKSNGSTPRVAGTQMTVLKDGSIIGTIGGGAIEKKIIELALEAIEDGEDKSIFLTLADEGMVCGGEIEIFIQVFKPSPEILIVGGGHVSLALYNVASLLNFDIVIFEDREEFISHERFPNAKKLIIGKIDKELKEYKISENTYIVIVTRGHKYDGEALEAVINSRAKYIGVIGSEKKVMNMFSTMKNRGITDYQLSKVYSPIGLNIADNSPEEIAISILAEILSVKNHKSGGHMKALN